MNRKQTALFLSGLLVLAGCGSKTDKTSAEPAETETAVAETERENPMETMSGDPIKAEEGYAFGFIGDRMSNAFFDFKVNSAETVESYEGLTAGDGNKLVVVNFTIQNTYQGEIPMFANDFYLVYNWDEQLYAEPVNATDDTKTVGNMLAKEYTLKRNETITGDAVYEIGADAKDVTLIYDEYYESGDFGDTFMVDFTLK